MIPMEDIRAAIVSALIDESSRCLDDIEDVRAVAHTATQRVLCMAAMHPDGPCTVCGRGERPVQLWLVGDHPNPTRMWVLEECRGCRARRLAEHECPSEDEDGDARVIAATPWRAG